MLSFFPDGPRYFEGNEFAAGDTGFNVSWTYKQPFWPFFIETTLLRSESSRFSSQQEDEPYPVYAPEIFHGTFDELQKIAEMEEATFTFAHITKPHSPLQFDRQGNVISVELSNDEPLKQEYFFDQLDYLNERMLQLIDHILAESTVPPIIIIQGDHSSDLGENVNSTCLYTFEILNAYHLPGDGAENLYPAIQPVNSFRVIFNHYFGQDYELLEHGHYTQPRACEHNDPTLVQVMDDERLNVEFGDHIALLYNAPGDNGTPQFQIHALNSDGEKGELLFTVSYKDVEEYLDSPPNQNTPIINRDGVVLYALTSGEFQFNIGPDAEGREWAIIIDILSSQVISGYEVGTDG